MSGNFAGVPSSLLSSKATFVKVSVAFYNSSNSEVAADFTMRGLA
jgi:hypothetical protein